MTASSTSTVQLMTVEEFMLRPACEDGVLEELVDGKVVVNSLSRPQIPHGETYRAVHWVLNVFVREKKLGRIYSETGVLVKRAPDTLRGPDLYFFSYETMPDVPEQGFFECIPDLVVEIVSPNDTASDLHHKVVQYLEAGVKQIWVIYPSSKDIVVYHSLDRVQHLQEQQILEGGSVLPGFTCKVKDLFGEIRS